MYKKMYIINVLYKCTINVHLYYTIIMYITYVHLLCTFIMYIMFVHVLWTRVIRGCYDASYNVHWMYISSGESYMYENNLCYFKKCTIRHLKCSFNV